MGKFLELDKRKYKRDEVKKILLGVDAENNAVILELKQKLAELSLENQKLKSEIEDFRQKDDNISSALKDAEAFSRAIKENALKKYSIETESLKSFSLRWRNYFELLKEKYPLYNKISESKKLFDEINKLTLNYSGKELIEKTQKVLDESGVPDSSEIFNPRAKIEDYISATSDNGFNLNDVLNPGELDVEELCKELDLIEK